MKLKFAIIGCGRIGARHAKHISNYGKLVAVCDIIPERVNEFALNYNANPYLTIEELLENENDLDIISICTPNGLHARHTIQSLDKGFHVLCEKPMAINTKDCRAMIAAAEKANKKLFIVKQNRFNPPVEKVKELIDQGLLGNIYSIQLNCFWNRNDDYYQNSWKGTKDLDGGTLFTQFSHFIDLLYWMIGDIQEVEAFIGNYSKKDIIEFEDTGVVILKFQKGTIGTINYTVNCIDKNMEGSLTIFAEKGTIKIGGQYLNELEYQSIKEYKIEGLPKGNVANDYGHYKGSMSNHDKVYQNVIDVLTNSGTITTNGLEGLKTVEIIEKIYKNAKLN